VCPTCWEDPHGIPSFSLFVLLGWLVDAGDPLVHRNVVSHILVTNNVGSGLDELIYWHFGYNLFLITISTALLLIYTRYSSALHMH
jgi:hypothetical protein